MKNRLRAYIAVAVAIILITGILPVSVLGEDESSEPSYTVSGLGSPYLRVTVNGKWVTPDSGGCITAKEGDKVKVIPHEGNVITEVKRLAQNPVIILNYPEDIWQNRSGYQMVLDEDGLEYGFYSKSNAVYFSDYYNRLNAFEYTIPADADYPSPSRFVYCGSDSISVLAGYYDYFIINHDPVNNRTQYAMSTGNTPGSNQHFLFENGYTYEYTVTPDKYDTEGRVRVDLTVTRTGPSTTTNFGALMNDGSCSFTMPAGNVDLSITLSGVFYELTEGEGSVFDPESGAPLKFVFKRSQDDDVTMDRFKGASVDDDDLREEVDYTIAKGSVIVEIMPSYLGGLSPGDHTLTVDFSDAGSVSAGFKVAASQAEPEPEPVPEKDNTAPDTGVSGRIWLYAWLIVMASLAAYEMIVRRGRDTR